MDLVTTLPNHG